MDIQSINTQTTEAFNQRETDNKGKLGQQEFLHLLVAQMRHQDPINPLDGAEFAAQLAQFNSVEQLINVNSGLQNLQDSQELMSANFTNSMAASLTGKQVRAIGDNIQMVAGEDVPVQFKLNNSASDVEVVIRNASGNEVRRESLGGMSSGENQWVWDGRSNNGDRLGDGEYTVEIQAENNGDSVDSLVYLEGIASKVRFSGSGVYLSVNNVEVPIGDVEEVGIDLF
jgi:flagellar basal-body rod modification protein FlgD